MILFIADIHIKLGQKNVPKKWAIDRYNKFFEIVKSYEPKITELIIGGDIFDRVPSLEELKLYFKWIGMISVPTIIYAGNHEATRKHQSFLPALIEVTKAINPLITIITKTTELNGYTILPYEDLHKKGSIEKCNPKLPLFTHVRGAIPPHVVPEVDLERFSPFPIVYSGDLHSHSNSQLNIVYPGSPMTIGFHRTKVKTGGILIDKKDLNSWKWVEFKLPQLIRTTVTKEEDMLATDYDHTIYEIEGNINDLAKISNTDLLDKKIVTRKSEATLDLSEATSITEELLAYLTEVMQLDKDTINNTMKEFNATAAQITVG